MEPGHGILRKPSHVSVPTGRVATAEARCRFVFRGAEGRGFLHGTTWELMKEGRVWRLGRLVDQRVT